MVAGIAEGLAEARAGLGEDGEAVLARVFRR
jgi:predicted transcriptional regulator